MNEQMYRRIEEKKGENLLTGYIEHELRPIDLYEEAEYLSEKCRISGADAFEFLCARDDIYTDCSSDAEFILCNSRDEIERELFFSNGTETDQGQSLSMLYHSNLYRLDSSSGKEEFRRYFPTVTSLEDIYATETENMFDD